MELRRFHPDDLTRLVDLHNTALAAEHEFIPYTEAKLQSELDEAKSIWVATVDERFVGAAFYYPMWYGNEIVPCAAPDVDSPEILTRLLDRIEADIDGDEGVIALPGGQSERTAFLEARGYKADGGMVQLITDLHEARPIYELPHGYSLRSLRPEEQTEFVEMVNTAYDAQRLSLDAFERWAANPGWSENWIQVVDHQNTLVAGVVARPDREFNEHFGANRGYLGPAAVLPEHGKQGLGRALTAAALNFARSQGMDRASLYTTQSNKAVHRLTEQLGFWRAHRWEFMKKDIPGER